MVCEGSNGPGFLTNSSSSLCASSTTARSVAGSEDSKSGGTLELLTAESAVEASELPAVTDTEVADLEASAGAIVEDPEWKA